MQKLDYLKFLLVMTPDKVIDWYTEIDSGLSYHYANKTVDKI